MDLEEGSIKYGQIWGEVEKFYLPHSCDEWVIGDLEKAKKFYDDLGRLIKRVDNA